MLKRERLTYILKQINLHNKVLSSDLSLQLKVSEDTIRRDLNELAEGGEILKVHGGALSKSFHFPLQQTEVYAKDDKHIIAQKTLKLIHNGMILLVGGGTTMIELARLIPDNLNITFFTVSPWVALELAEHPRVDVHLIGGRLVKNTQITTGTEVIDLLSDIRVDLCLLGTNSLSPDEGLTDSDWDVVQVKKAMVKSAKKVAVLSIAEKLGSVQKMRICGFNDIDYLITNLAPEDASLKAYQQVVQLI